MDFIKKIILLLTLSLSLFSFSKQPENVKKEDFALLVKPTNICKQEISFTIKEILDIKNLKLSENIFTKKSYIDIEHKKIGYKKFLLYERDNECYLSHVCRYDIMIKSKKLQKCTCKRVKNR